MYIVPRIPCVCENCGIEFGARPCYLRKGPVRFCGRACYRAFNRGPNSPTWKGGTRSVVCAGCGVTFERPLTWMKNRPSEFCTQDCRVKYQRAHPELATGYKGGVAVIHYGIRKSWEYTEWRKSVMRRDNYTCQKCGKHGGRLTAHHLYRFSEFPHLRLNVGNGHTLCRDCHLGIKGREDEYLRSIGLSPLQPPLF